MFPVLDIHQVTLPNNLRLVTIRRPGTPTVALKAYVRAGSRYDSEQFGLAHLLEHVLFAGTKTRTGSEIFGTIERRGGTIGAHTHREYTTVWAVLPANGWTLGIDILADVLCHTDLQKSSFEKEKQIVVEEIRAAQDKRTVLYDLFVQALWQTNPLRYPLRGMLSGLAMATYEDLVAFYHERYVTGNTVFVACGDLDHEQVAQQVETLFADFRPGHEQLPGHYPELPLEGRRATHLNRELYQTYILLGVPTVSMKHSDRYPLKVIERALNMGGSARLYQRLRTKRPLAHTFHTLNVLYEDAGYLAINIVCNPQHIEEVEHILLEEWQRLASEGITETELEAAKENYAGSLACNFETNLSLAGVFGVEALLNAVEPFTESIARIQAVDLNSIRTTAQRYLTPERYVRASIGPDPGHLREIVRPRG